MLPEDALMLKDFVSAYKAWEKSVQLDLSHSQKEELFNEYARIRDLYFSHLNKGRRHLLVN